MLSVKGERVNDTLSLPSWCSQTSEDVEIQAVKSDEERSQSKRAKQESESISKNQMYCKSYG